MHSSLHNIEFPKVSLKLCKYLPSFLNKVHLQSDTILGLRKWFYLFMHVVQPSPLPLPPLLYVFLFLIAQDPDSFPCEYIIFASKQFCMESQQRSSIGQTYSSVHCCKSSERFGLKCEFSLVSNKYIPYIGLVLIPLLCREGFLFLPCNN